MGKTFKEILAILTQWRNYMLRGIPSYDYTVGSVKNFYYDGSDNIEYIEYVRDGVPPFHKKLTYSGNNIIKEEIIAGLVNP